MFKMPIIGNVDIVSVIENYSYYKSFAELYDLGFNTLNKLHRLIEVMAENKGNMPKIEMLLNEILSERTEPELPYNPYRELIKLIDKKGSSKQ